MAKGLKGYFPQIRTRKEVLEEIHQNEICAYQFEQWGDEQKDEFLDFCTGVRGIKMTYDSFFKEIMNPEFHPERLEELLSILLEQRVHIKQILPNDSVRLADEGTLLITDIVVELEDGSLANVEIQKIGYAFPGQRGACYSSDLLLRQYKRVKSRKKKKFTYQDMKTVYTILFFEKSTSEFHQIKSEYILRAKQVFQSGLELDMLQEYVLIPLDIYKESKHNKAIENKLEAWLSFLCDDSPERILELIEKYPSFKDMYEDVYETCRNIEGVMDMFSKELQELDRNTVQLMIDEMQEDLKQKGKELDLINQKLGEKNQELDEKNQELNEKNQKLNEKSQELDEKNQELQAALARIHELEEEKKKANQ